MTAETKGNPALVAVLSILGILAVTLAAGLVLMQKQEGASVGLGPALSSRQTVPETDDFDPISWAREGAAYPPLMESENAEGEFVADYTGAGALPETEGEPAAPVVTTQPAAVSPPPEPVKPAEPAYREVRENAWWVQVFSSDNLSRAEDIRDELASKGLPANVIVREVDGKTWYRVRIGAFDDEDEAEHYADEARMLAGYESSYVVQAPVTRRVAVGN